MKPLKRSKSSERRNIVAKDANADNCCVISSENITRRQRYVKKFEALARFCGAFRKRWFSTNLDK